MKRTKIIELLQGSLIGQQVNVKGWVRTRRGNKAISFIALNDGSTIHNIQIVVDLARFDADLLAKITTGQVSASSASSLPPKVKARA